MGGGECSERILRIPLPAVSRRRRVLRVGRDGVRLGVVAPAHVPVHRQEVYAQIREANDAASKVALEPELVQRLRRPA